MATQGDDSMLGFWAVGCDPVAGEVFIELDPDTWVLLGAEAAMSMAQHLAINAAAVHAGQAALIGHCSCVDDEEAPG